MNTNYSPNYLWLWQRRRRSGRKGRRVRKIEKEANKRPSNYVKREARGIKRKEGEKENEKEGKKGRKIEGAEKRVGLSVAHARRDDFVEE